MAISTAFASLLNSSASRRSRARRRRRICSFTVTPPEPSHPFRVPPLSCVWAAVAVLTIEVWHSQRKYVKGVGAGSGNYAAASASFFCSRYSAPLRRRAAIQASYVPSRFLASTMRLKRSIAETF